MAAPAVDVNQPITSAKTAAIRNYTTQPRLGTFYYFLHTLFKYNHNSSK